MFDPENNESTPSDLGNFSPQPVVTILAFVGNECTPGRKSLPKCFSSVDEHIIYTDEDEDDGEMTEQKVNDSTVHDHLNIISNLENVHKFMAHTKHMTAVDSQQTLFMETITPIFDVENRMAESCPCRNSVCLEGHTTTEVHERESFRGVDTSLPVSILSHKTGHTVTALGYEQDSSIVNVSELKPFEAATNNDAASKSDVCTNDDNNASCTTTDT